MIAIIPARGGSTRIPRKNIKIFHGKPIIAYSIETAIESKLFDNIFVSTDDKEISEISLEAGAKVWLRPDELSRNEVGTQEVVASLLVQMEALDIKLPEYSCVIYATAPLMLPEDLKNGYRMLSENSLDYIHSVDVNKQDAGQWYWGRTQAFIDRIPLLGGEKSWKFMIPSDRVCDINYPEDWERAETMYEVMKCMKS